MKVEKSATKYLQSNTNWFIILLFNLFTCLFRETDHIQVVKYHLFLNQFCSIAQKPERLNISQVHILSGDYVLRDPAGGPRGMVRVMMKWKYPFQPPVDALLGRQGSRADVQGRARESSEREERRREKDDASQRPIAKPRVKVRKVHDICVFKDTSYPL